MTQQLLTTRRVLRSAGLLPRWNWFCDQMDMATRTAMEIHHQSSQNPKPAKMGEREQNAAGMLKYVAEQAAPFFQRVDEERFRHISEWLIFFMPYARVIGGASAFQGSSTRALANCIDEDVSETEQIFFMCMPHFSKSLPKLRAQYEEKTSFRMLQRSLFFRHWFDLMMPQLTTK